MSDTKVPFPNPTLHAGQRLVVSGYARAQVADYGDKRAAERDAFWQREAASAAPTQGAEGAAPQAVVGEASEQRKHVGDSSFEGWFAENYRRLAITSKQAARETYAAGMNDENVLSELQANDSIISGQERRIAQLEADITAIEADILACSSSEAEIEAQRIAIDVYHRRGAMLGSEWSLLSSLIRLAASPAPSAAPQEADALREAAQVAIDVLDHYLHGGSEFRKPAVRAINALSAALAQHQPQQGEQR